MLLSQRSPAVRPIGSLIAAAVLAAVALASPVAAVDSPWTLGLGFGQASIDTALAPGALGWRVDDEDTAARVVLGYTFHPYFGIEAGYHDFGSYPGLAGKCLDEVCPQTLLVAVHPESVDFTGVSLVAVPRWPVTGRFVLFGKLGVLDWRGDVTPLFSGQSLSDPSDTDLLAGLGARFDVSRSFGVQLEYEGTDLYDSLSLGANWRF